jgi:hypothetical protein
MGKGTTALKKINARTKKLKKLHPGKKYSTLRSQAAREYNAGTIPKARKKRAKVTGKRKYKVYHEVKKVGRKRKRAPRKKTTTAVRYKTRTRTVTKVRRVGAMKKSSIGLIIGLGAAAVVGYLLLSKSATPALPLVVPKTTAAGTAATNNILAYAQAAGATATQLAALINSLNGSSDAAVVSASQEINTNPSVPDLTNLLPQGGPGITLNTLQYD